MDGKGRLFGSLPDGAGRETGIRLTADEAYTFLKQIEDIENTGILCRIPNWWKKDAASVSMAVSLGDEKPSMLGFDALVFMKPKLMVDGMELTEEDVRRLLANIGGISRSTVNRTRQSLRRSRRRARRKRRQRVGY